MKTAIIFGSSGLIGNELFKTILLKNIYSKINSYNNEIKKIRISSEGQYFTPWKDDIFAERLKELA